MTQAKSKAKTVRIEPDLDFVREIKAAGGDSVKKCFQCATCSTVCPISPEDGPFPRKEMLWAAWGLKDRLVKDPDIWLCHQCNDCSTNCPRGARPGDVLAAIRKRAFEHYAVPQALGRAVGSPTWLFPLLMVPTAIIALIMWKGQAYNDAMPEVLRHMSWYGHTFPLLAVDTLFIVTLTLMAILMITSLTKFWKDMVEGMPGEAKKSFIQAAIDTVTEIIKHERFDKCEKAVPRRLGHQLTFYGMILLFVTTACVFIGLYFFHMEIPMSVANPIKMLGILSAVLFCAGLFMLWNTRLNDPDAAGNSTYQDMLFLWVLVIVALSGVGAYLLRLSAGAGIDASDCLIHHEQHDWACPDPANPVTTVAVAVYFVHLVTVWFLLAYLPFSKFAHMVYRTFALIRAHQVDRWAPLSGAKPVAAAQVTADDDAEDKHGEDDSKDDDDEEKS
jgi:quinone-modifying oxidoreductase subunit QmoC